MTRLISRVFLAAAVVCITAVVALAQQTTSSTETKSFEIIWVEGNQLDVRLPEGTRELTVPDDFRFIVNGQSLSVRELKPGMKGTATITTRTTVTPVTITEVKSGTVAARSGSNLIVRTGGDVKMFSQGDIDKRGVKIMREGKPAQLSDFREGDRITATIITAAPPKVLTEKEVLAYVPPAATAGAAPVAAGTAPAPPPARAAAPAPVAARPTTAAASAPAAPPPAPAAEAQTARTLPKTASSWPILALASVLSLAMGLALTIRRRLVR